MPTSSALAERRARLRDAGMWDLGAAIREDPVRAAQDILGRELWSIQQQILLSTFAHPRTAVRSGNGVGKTFTAGTVAPLFALAYPHSTVLTTAPTGRQVREVLWREIRKAWNDARLTIDRAMRELGVDYVPLPEAKQVGIDLAEDWFMLGQSTDEPERFAGYHAEHLLLVVDEASGVKDSIYDAAEGNLTSGGAHMLLIGNPTQTSGQFYRCFTKDAASWERIHISVLDSPNFTKEKVSDAIHRRTTSRSWVEDRLKRWGRDHPLSQVRIFGNFPSTADRTMISLAQVEEAQRRDTIREAVLMDAHPVIAIDVARFGRDETVIAVKRGPVVRILDAYAGRRTTHTVGRALHHAQNLLGANCLGVTIIVDDVGVGGGVTDQLVELASDRMTINPYNGGEKAIDEEHYANRRTETWHQFSLALDADVVLDTDEQLTADLVAPEYKFTSRGQMQLEPKDDTKKRLGASPDRGDAVVMLLDPGSPIRVPTPLTDDLPEDPSILTGRRASWESRF